MDIGTAGYGVRSSILNSSPLCFQMVFIRTHAIIQASSKDGRFSILKGIFRRFPNLRILTLVNEILGHFPALVFRALRRLIGRSRGSSRSWVWWTLRPGLGRAPGAVVLIGRSAFGNPKWDRHVEEIVYRPVRDQSLVH